MSLSSSALSTAMWNAVVATIPTATSAVRSNPFATPAVPAHIPLQEILAQFAAGVVTNLVGIPFTATATGTHTGPQPVILDSSISFQNVAANKAIAQASIIAALGWGGVSGSVLTDAIVDGLFDYVSTSSTYTGMSSVNSGSTAISHVVVSHPNPPGLGAAISASVQAGLLGTGYFHYADEPTNGLAQGLVDLVDSISDTLPTLLGSSNTSIVVPSIGPAAGCVITLTGVTS